MILTFFPTNNRVHNGLDVTRKTPNHGGDIPVTTEIIIEQQIRNRKNGTCWLYTFALTLVPYL